MRETHWREIRRDIPIGIFQNIPKATKTFSSFQIHLVIAIEHIKNLLKLINLQEPNCRAIVDAVKIEGDANEIITVRNASNFLCRSSWISLF